MSGIPKIFKKKTCLRQNFRETPLNETQQAGLLGLKQTWDPEPPHSLSSLLHPLWQPWEPTGPSLKTMDEFSGAGMEALNASLTSSPWGALGQFAELLNEAQFPRCKMELTPNRVAMSSTQEKENSCKTLSPVPVRW